MPQDCTVKTVEGAGEDTAWVTFFMDDAVSVEVEWEAAGGRCLARSQSLASIHFQALGERAEGEEPLLSTRR